MRKSKITIKSKKAIKSKKTIHTIKKIGIITSGGDCGGLNAVIKGIASTANSIKIETVVIPNGYAGLYNLIDFPINKLTPLNTKRLDKFSSALAGSEAGHSRVKISKINDKLKYEKIKKGLKKHKIDALIVSGGDDSGSVVVDLCKHGIPTNHAPKTMDLDLQTYSVGADSTINNIANAIEDLKTTGRTHNRIMILETFGRYVGHTAFRGGIAGDADCIIIPEIAPNFDIIYEHMKKTFMNRVLNSDVHAGIYNIITSEALKGNPKFDDVNEEGFLIDKSVKPDAFGHYPMDGAAKRIAKELEKRLEKDPEIKIFMKKTGMFIKHQYETPEVRIVKPTHLMRCGRSSAYDVNFGREVGAGTLLLLLENIYGITCIGIENGTIKYLPTKKAIEQRPVNLNQVTFYELQGFCFGRKKPKTKVKIKHIKSQISRHM